MNIRFYSFVFHNKRVNRNWHSYLPTGIFITTRNSQLANSKPTGILIYQLAFLFTNWHFYSNWQIRNQLAFLLQQLAFLCKQLAKLCKQRANLFHQLALLLQLATCNWQLAK